MPIDYGASETLLDDEHIIHCHLIEVETLTGTLRYNTSGWDFVWAGQTWFAGGGVLGLDLPEEDANLEAHNAAIKIASLTPSQTSLALSQNLHGRYVAAYHAVMNANYQIVAAPKVFSGRVSHLVLDKPAI